MAKKKNNEAEMEQTPALSTETSVEGKLPVFLEIVFDISNLIMVMVPSVVAVMSYVSGADWTNIVLRTAVTILVTGLMCSGITRSIVSRSVEVTNQMLEAAAQTGTTVDQQG